LAGDQFLSGLKMRLLWGRRRREPDDRPGRVAEVSVEFERRESLNLLTKSRELVWSPAKISSESKTES